MNSDRIAVVSSLAIQKANYATDLLSVAFKVKYVGAQASGKVAVDAATGNLAFTHGVLSSEVADTTVVASTGVIVVSSLNLGTVIDTINASANWKAVLVGGLRSDDATNTLVTMGATQAKYTYGLAICFDAAVAPTPISLAISQKGWEALKGSDGNVFSVDETDYIHSLIYWRQKNTFASGTSLIDVYEVDRATARETKIYEEASAATTVVGSHDFSTYGNGYGLCAAKGCDLIVRMTGSAYTTGYLEVFGASRKFGY